MKMLYFAFTSPSRNSAASSLNVPYPTRVCMVIRSFGNRRMVTTGVSMDAGGRTTLTRSPPGSRVSTMGFARFTSRPAPATIRWMISSSSFSLEKVRGDRSTSPFRSMKSTSQALIMISDTVSSFRYSSRMPSPRKLPYSVSTNRESSSAEKSWSGFCRSRIFRMRVRRDSSSIAERPSVRYSSRRTRRRTSCS